MDCFFPVPVAILMFSSCPTFADHIPGSDGAGDVAQMAEMPVDAGSDGAIRRILPRGDHGSPLSFPMFGGVAMRCRVKREGFGRGVKGEVHAPSITCSARRM